MARLQDGLSGSETHQRPLRMARRLMGFAAAQPILRSVPEGSGPAFPAPYSDPPARATYGRAACVIRSLSRWLRCYQFQHEAQFYVRNSSPPCVQGFVRGPGCSPHGRGFFFDSPHAAVDCAFGGRGYDSLHAWIDAMKIDGRVGKANGSGRSLPSGRPEAGPVGPAR